MSMFILDLSLPLDPILHPVKNFDFDWVKYISPFTKPFKTGIFSEFYTRSYYRDSDHPPGGM